jgi:RNA polymerase sigma-70 factor (ECF subfamily)
MDVHAEEVELRALMLAGLDGDAAAHVALLKRLSPRLRAYLKNQLRRFGRGPVEAEDLTQETLIAIHTRRHMYDRTQLFTPWVQAVARYKFTDYLRRTKLSARHTDIEEVQDTLSEEETAGTDGRLDLELLLAQLPVKMRRAIELVKLGGLSTSEAAAASGMSPSAVKVSVHRGVKALALLVKRKGAAHEDR